MNLNYRLIKWPLLNGLDVPSRTILLLSVFIALCIGTTMISSASMPYSQNMYHQPLHYISLHLLYLLIGLTTAYIATFIPLKLWFSQTIALWMLCILLLISVFGFRAINGSHRWIQLFGFTFQPSELAKFVMVLFTADYVVRRQSEIRFSLFGFLRLCIPLGSILLLLLAEPDLGAGVVVTASMMTVFFLAGAPTKQFITLIFVAFGSLIAAIVTSPYRFERLMSFTNPWDDPLGTDYQLKQSLLAFGHGGWFGTGLGQSVQKLAYLPEAHTDFLLAIIGEELGFVGITTLFCVLGLILFSSMHIGHTALKNRHLRAGYLAYGISSIFLIQIFVNSGMNMGLIPTKGLTLPFVSYGGTSLLISLLMIGVLLRIDRETQQEAPRPPRSAFNKNVY